MADQKTIIDLTGLNEFRKELEARTLKPAQVAQIMVEQLENYMTAEQVEQAIATLASSALSREVVTALPLVGAAAANVIYMVPATDGGAGDTYDEFVLINGKWEKIGSTRVDLSGYVKADDLEFATAAEILALWDE